MAIVTGALEAMLTNYDKRIRPGYGGKPKNKELFAKPFPYSVLFCWICLPTMIKEYAPDMEVNLK